LEVANLFTFGIMGEHGIINISNNQLTGEISEGLCISEEAPMGPPTYFFNNFGYNQFCPPYPPICSIHPDINSQDTSNCP